MSTSNKSMKSIFGAFILTSASLFGGAAVALANTDNAQQVEVIQAHKSFAETNQIQAKQILFIDSAVADAPTLLKGLDPAVEVLLLDEGQGLERIAARLEGRHGIDAIHLISHGEPGALLLGGSRVEQANLQNYSDELASIGEALSEDGDLLVYGCNVAAGDPGGAFVRRLGEMTGADVAASDDSTGAADLGGDWELEKSVGEIGSSAALLTTGYENYSKLLAVVNFNDIPDADNTILATFLNGSYTEPSNTITVTMTAGADSTVPDNPSLSVTNSDIDSSRALILCDLSCPLGALTEVSITKAGGGNFSFNSLGVNTPMSGATLTAQVEGWKGVSMVYGPEPLVMGLNTTTIVSVTGWDSLDKVVIKATSNDIYNVAIDNFTYGAEVISNAAPTVTTSPPSITVTEDTLSNVVLGAATFADTDGDLLTVTLTASAGTFTSASGGSVTVGGSGTGILTLDGSAANINTFLDTVTNIKYTGATNDNGTGAATLTISATDGADPLSSDPTVSINITAVNDEPGFTAANPSAVNEESGAQSVAGWVSSFNPGPANEAGQAALAYTVSNVSNSSLFSAAPAVSAAGTLTYTPAADAFGTSTFDVAVQDDGGTANSGDDTSPTQTFTITVNGVNDEPSFTAADPSAVNEDSGAQSVVGWVTGFNSGSAAEAGQSVLAYSVSNVSNSGLFSAAPAVSATGTLTFTPAANVSGTSTFDVAVQDDGGTANGGDDTSPTQTFTITVNSVNDEPSFTAADPSAVNEESGAQSVAGWVSGFNPGPADEAGQSALAYSVSNVSNSSLFSAAPAVSAAGTLTYTPAADAFGTSTFDVAVQDDGGTANSGDDTSPTQTFTITVNGVNDEPSFTAADPSAVNEDSGAQSVVGWVTGFNSGSAAEAGQSVLAYSVSNVSNSGLFSAAPAVSATGTLTFTPAANVSGTSTFDVAVQDDGGTANGGDDTSPTQTFTITVNGVNDVPSLNLDLDNSSGAGGNDFNTTFAAEGAAVTIADIDAALADVDVGDTVDSLTVTITNVQDVGLESLALNAAATTAAAGLTVTPGTTLTVTGSATPTTYQSILRGVVYNNTAASGAITTAPARVVTAIAADGGGNSLTATANITVVAAPVVDLNGGGAGNDLAGAYSEGDGVTLEAVLATVVEPEAQNLDQLLITLTNPLDGGLESITLAGRANTDVVNGITITYTSSLITLTGSATDANYQLLLQELQYSNTSEDPDTTARTITVQGRDITAAVGAVATLTLSMTAVNDQPVFTALDGTPAFTENAASVTLDNDVTVADFELDAVNNYNGATLTLVRNGGANADDQFTATGSLSVLTETLGFNLGAGDIGTVTTNSAGTLVLSFNASATAANVDTVLQSINYSNNNEAPPASAQIDWSFNDGNSGAQGTGGALVATGSTTVSITAVNDAPVLSAAPTPIITSIIEDVLSVNNVGTTVASMVADGSVTDVDAAAVEAVAIIGTDSANGLWQYSINNGASWNTLTGASIATARLLDATNKVRFVPNANWFGTSSLSFVAWDQSTGAVGGTADVTTRGTTTAYSLVSDVAGITVTAVNDAPIITSDGGGANAAINSAENQTAVTAMVASDVEGDTRSYSLTGGADQGLFNVTTGGVLTFKNAPDFETKADAGANGVYDVQVTVTDNGVGPLTDVQDIAVTVTNINEAPTISGAPSTLTPVDTVLFSFTPTVDDVDAGTSFTYSIDNTPSWAIFSTTTGELTGIPAFADIGEVTNIIITVSDGLLSDSLPVFTLTVNKNNTAPTISGIADPEVGENTNYSFVPISDDIDNDVLVFSITNKPIWATFDTATGGLSGVPGNANIGSYNNIVINVDDGLSNVDLAAFSILVFADLDGDEISDATDPDIDGDGMTNVYEDANGLDKRDASDRDTDLDGDGVSNYDELVAGSNANVDDSLPVVTPQADVTVDAVGLFTLVDIGTATAFDSTDGELIPTSDAPSHFAPGAHIVTWSATDAAGNTGTATQLVNVNPMVNLSNDQIAAEGSAISFSIILNGDAVSYPVSVPYTVSGTASTDGSDHDLFDGVAIINSGTETAVSFVTVDDGAGEGSENIIITLGAPINAVVGNVTTQTIEIVEGNVSPMVSLSADQGTGSTLTVTQTDGTVEVSSFVTDANIGDTHSYDWSLSDNALVDVDGTDSTFTFDPLSVNPGFYTLHLSVNDGTDSTASSISLTVLAAAPVLTTADSDGDGTNDHTEGYDDSDGDGIADYLDSIVTINVLPAQFGEDQLYLIETLPGLSLTLGNIALQSGIAQASILMVDVTNAGGITDNTNFNHDTGLFDIIVTGVASGQAVNVVIPQLAAVPAYAIYRNLTSAGWQTFVRDADNLIFSAAGVEGYCPPPGDAAYQPGLTEGDLCVQLTIIDGGPSDADGVVNNRVAIIGGVTQPVDGGGGGGGSLQPLWLILLLGLLMQQRKLISQKRTES